MRYDDYRDIEGKDVSKYEFLAATKASYDAVEVALKHIALHLGVEAKVEYGCGDARVWIASENFGLSVLFENYLEWDGYERTEPTKFWFLRVVGYGKTDNAIESFFRLHCPKEWRTIRKLYN